MFCCNVLMRSCSHSLEWKMAGRSLWAAKEWFKYEYKQNWLSNNKTIWLNSVIAKYRNLSVPRRSNDNWSALYRDKSQYFAPPRPINYLHLELNAGAQNRSRQLRMSEVKYRRRPRPYPCLSYLILLKTKPCFGYMAPDLAKNFNSRFSCDVVVFRN